MHLSWAEFKSNPFFLKLNSLEKATLKAIFLGFDVEKVLNNPFMAVDVTDPIQVSVACASTVYKDVTGRLPSFCAEQGVDDIQSNPINILNVISETFHTADTENYPRIIDLNMLQSMDEKYRSCGVDFSMRDVLIAGLSVMMDDVKKTAPDLHQSIKTVMHLMGFNTQLEIRPNKKEVVMGLGKNPAKRGRVSEMDKDKEDSQPLKKPKQQSK